ncbi:Tryptophan synthase alpha chain [Labilithrix luteola]|uniref:Tryptophan synthase alpha chain n=1 Tax=Labilithrix luteola TaxID=1391654 RepID=A0A0K1PQY6_9BACT|nr:Tryptophan synthase alpha chain [Labilithrix luteola]
MLLEACQGDRRIVATEPPAPPSFSGEDAGEAGTSEIALCPTNACQPGRVTCPDSPFLCGVDLSSDDDNCGACGNRCPKLGAVNALTKCIDGECKLGCTTAKMDCNGLAEDGCEVDVTRDNQNCGVCGHACPANFSCSAGECVCAISNSCGACGNVCPPDEEPPFPEEWNMMRDCASGACNVPMCAQFYADCNKNASDPAGDGCETNTSSDPKNCGGCGVECGAEEYCMVVDQRPTCVCPCGASCFNLSDDIDNCGACGFACPGDPRSAKMAATPNGDPDPAHGRPVCVTGICDYKCSANWGDCDSNIDNGCETDLRRDPHNCGACGVRCEGVEGQACIDGKCAMQECSTTTN